jgi:hypothetical protein
MSKLRSDVARLVDKVDEHFKLAGIDPDHQSGYCAAWLSDICSLVDRQRFGLAALVPVTPELWREVVLVYVGRYRAVLRKPEPALPDVEELSA